MLNRERPGWIGRPSQMGLLKRITMLTRIADYNCAISLGFFCLSKSSMLLCAPPSLVPVATAWLDKHSARLGSEFGSGHKDSRFCSAAPFQHLFMLYHMSEYAADWHPYRLRVKLTNIIKHPSMLSRSLAGRLHSLIFWLLCEKPSNKQKRKLHIKPKKDESGCQGKTEQLSLKTNFLKR